MPVQVTLLLNLQGQGNISSGNIVQKDLNIRGKFWDSKPNLQDFDKNDQEFQPVLSKSQKKNLKHKKKLALKEGHCNARSRADSSSPTL